MHFGRPLTLSPCWAFNDSDQALACRGGRGRTRWCRRPSCALAVHPLSRPRTIGARTIRLDRQPADSGPMFSVAIWQPPKATAIAPISCFRSTSSGRTLNRQDMSETIDRPTEEMGLEPARNVGMIFAALAAANDGGPDLVGIDDVPGRRGRGIHEARFVRLRDGGCGWACAVLCVVGRDGLGQSPVVVPRRSIGRNFLGHPWRMSRGGALVTLGKPGVYDQRPYRSSVGRLDCPGVFECCCEALAAKEGRGMCPDLSALHLTSHVQWIRSATIVKVAARWPFT